MIKTVVFDWNGTLLADTAACLAASNHVIKAIGGKAITMKTYRETFITPIIDFYEYHGHNREDIVRNSEKIGHLFHTFYEDRAKNCRSRGGAKTLLAWLKKNNIQAVILSNHTVNGIHAQLKRLKINQYIDDVLANTALDGAVHKRNKLDKLKIYLKQNHFKQNEAIIIGDTAEEIEMGKAVGIKTIAISGGYSNDKRLKHAGPDFLIKKLPKVEGIIKKLV